MEEVSEAWPGGFFQAGVRRIENFLEDERRFWGLAALLFGTVAVLRACSTPNSWIATQAQLNYDQGFVKRGLFGEIFTKPLHLYTLGRFAAVWYVFFAIFLILLVRFTVKSEVLHRVGYGEIVAVFFSSYCLSYLVHDTGYYDVILAALAIPVLMVRSDVHRFLLSLPASALGLLFHEMFLVVFLPVVLFSFVLRAGTTSYSSVRRRALILAAVLAAFSLLLTIVIAAQPSLGVEQARAQMAEIRAHVHFVAAPDMYDLMTRSLGDNLRLTQMQYRNPLWWLGQVASVIMFLPTVALVWICSYRVLAAARQRPPRWLFFYAGVASLAPLGMHLLGFDVVRWNSLVGLTSFLVLLTICLGVDGPHVSTSRGFRHACVIAIALSLSSGGSLITGRLLPYPFINDPVFVRALQKLPVPMPGAGTSTR